MGEISASEAIGYFWMLVVLVFAVLIWWKVSSLINNDELCVLQSGFECKEKRLYAFENEAKLDIAVQNRVGRWIQVTGFLCSSETPNPSIGKPDRVFEEVQIDALPDSVFTVSGTCHRGPTDSERGKFRGIVYLRYEFKDEPFTPGSQVIVGNIRGEVG